MNGVDTSSYQGSLNVGNTNFQFCVIKATEGNNYVNPYCDTHYQECKNSGKLRGVYHFSDHGDANSEAEFFVNNTKGYIGDGILVLDWEGNFVSDVNWAKTWLDRVYQLTGVRPLIYMSSSVVNAYDWSSVVNANYGLWVANYGINNGSMNSAPNVKWWSTYFIWQYTSVGRIANYNGNLDLDVAYGDVNTWNAYAKSNQNKGDDDMIDQDTLNKLYNSILGRDPDQAGIDHYVGHYSTSFVVNDLYNSTEANSHRQSIANLENTINSDNQIISDDNAKISDLTNKNSTDQTTIATDEAKISDQSKQIDNLNTTINNYAIKENQMNTVKKALSDLISKLFANFGSKKFQASILALIAGITSAPHFNGKIELLVYIVGLLPVILYVIVEGALDLAGIFKGKTFETQIAEKINDFATTLAMSTKNINNNVTNITTAVEDASKDAIATTENK